MTERQSDRGEGVAQVGADITLLPPSSAAQKGRLAKQALRRAALLEAARSLFIEYGWDKTSVATIVAKAGVAQGTFYLYFESKENVLAHLRQQVLVQYVAAFDRGRLSSTAADEGLVAGLAQVAQAVNDNHALVHVFRSASTGAQTQQVWLDGRERFAKPLAELIELGVARGEFQVDDARLAAHFLLALFDDLIYEASQYGRPAPIETTLRLATRFALRALNVTPTRVEALTYTNPASVRPGRPPKALRHRASKIGTSS